MMQGQENEHTANLWLMHDARRCFDPACVHAAVLLFQHVCAVCHSLLLLLLQQALC
jgi:hypothetical protein